MTTNSVSGQTNQYNFSFTPVSDECPVNKIEIYTDRNNYDGNYMNLVVSDKFQNQKSLVYVNGYVNHYFKNYNANLIKFERHRIISSRIVNRSIIPKRIRVVGYLNSSNVIKVIKKNKHISIKDHSRIKELLIELGTSSRFSSKVAESDSEISEAQKDLIKDIISPYIEGIQDFQKDYMISRKLVEFTMESLPSLGQIHTKNQLQMMLFNESMDPNSKDLAKVYIDCLIDLAKCGACMGDLESTFEKTGSALPSREFIQKMILDALKEAYKVN